MIILYVFNVVLMVEIDDDVIMNGIFFMNTDEKKKVCLWLIVYLLSEDMILFAI